MKVEVVPVEWVARTWPMASGFIEDALLYGNGEYTADQALVHISEGRWQLVVAVDDARKIRGAVVLNYFNRPSQRVAYIIAVGGRLISSQDTAAQLKNIMASHGATHLEGSARPAVARLWERFGITELYRTVGAKL